MIKDRAKIGITAALFLTLLLYHIFSVVGQLGDTIHWWTSVMRLYQIASLMATALFFLWAINADFLVRAVLGEDFIGGSYEGRSEGYSKHTDNTASGGDHHIEKFRILQSLFSVRISGCSYLSDKTEKLVASYKGEQFKWDLKKAVFAIEMTTDTTEYGILEVIFHNRSAGGMYWSANPNSVTSNQENQARFTVQRVG
jgi:hypothetical protein